MSYQRIMTPTDVGGPIVLAQRLDAMQARRASIKRQNQLWKIDVDNMRRAMSAGLLIAHGRYALDSRPVSGHRPKSVVLMKEQISMGFDSGALAFTRFNVVGEVSRLPDQETLDRFAALALREDELTTAEVDYGWVGGRHMLDGDFNVGNCVYNDAIHVGLRIDTNKVPSELKKAYIALEENASAASNPSGFASKKQKRDARETAKRKIEEDLASGKFRRSKVINVLWDMPSSTVYAAVSTSQRDQLIELFERTHNVSLEPISSGNLALNRLEHFGKRREYEDFTPTRFATIAGDPPAEYPWTAKGDQAKDYIGNEFLMWLWHTASSRGGEVALGDHAATVMFTKNLDLDCCYGQSGRTGLKYETPTDMPEAIEAIRSGKVPRKTGLTIALHGQLYTLALSAETLSISGMKLPEIEKADSPRVLFEERITLLRDFMKGFDLMFDAFIKQRAGESWDGHVEQTRKWITGKSRVAGVSAMVAPVVKRVVEREVAESA